MKVKLLYKTNEGKIIAKIINKKNEALFQAHSNVIFNKIWKGSVVFAPNKSGKFDGIYKQYGEDLLKKRRKK